MNLLKKSKVLAVMALSSSVCLADIYNHGNHNDDQVLFADDSISTLNCGSSTLATCISGVNLTNVTQQWCRNKVTDDTDGPLLFGQGYYHTVQSYALHIMSATDNDYDASTNDYSVDIDYSCSGLSHPAIKMHRSE